ncbi:hypothetical protein RND81_08G104200 [Saponaria officinalis]|uniref:Glycosyltransferase family 92 protein n=1 Tax=Saponaria officinalis TaxID=3572 RepID=A0AAW1J6L5_SAPOF
MAGGPYSSLTQPPSSSFSVQCLVTRILLIGLVSSTLAAFTFVLQWRGGGVTDPFTRYPSEAHILHGMGTSTPVNATPSSSRHLSSDCGPLLANSSASPPYSRDWKFQFQSNLKPKIAICTTTSASLDQILPWMFYHKVIGVTMFYLFVEGKAASPEVTSVLDAIPGVKVIYRTKELEQQQATSQIWNEPWMAIFFDKPCSYKLFLKQSLNMEMAVVMARNDGVDWILHLDTDELVHPAGAREYSLRQLLLDIPSNVDIVVFPNYESSVERDDVQDPFSEVSMFKKNSNRLPKDTYTAFFKEATRGNPTYFMTYSNGKSIARMHDHLRPNGAHKWYNDMKTPNDIKFEEAAVLHYTYSKFSDMTTRRDRCECKPTKVDVQRCFMLEFDKAAFIIASTSTVEEMRKWYRDHVVWGDEALNLKLLRNGILTRIYAPMIIIQGLRESGLFKSVIASASNSTLVDTSRNVGKTTNSKVTARKVFEVTDVDAREAVVPPLPPTGVDDNIIHETS